MVGGEYIKLVFDEQHLYTGVENRIIEYGGYTNMINENKVKRFCCEDISLIENYDKAINDPNTCWHCHHRNEFFAGISVSMNLLKDIGLYYDCPADELIFLSMKEHRSLHGRNMSKNTLAKLSRTSKGRCHSDEVKKRISDSKKKNYHPYRGKHLSRDMRMKMSKALKGRVFSEEHRRKISEALRGNSNGRKKIDGWPPSIFSSLPFS